MGPLRGTKVVELASIGPGPFCAMLLADLGAEVLAVDRPAAGQPGWPALFGRGRRRVAVDLKHPEGPGVVLDLVAGADALVEGFRPGVAERLGIGPDACLARNPGLVYGRVTGWGQDGPLARSAGHDIDYIALAGALHPLGPADGPPVPPLNLLGDFGGGGMLLALGVVGSLLEAARSGRGQVVDAAMVDGADCSPPSFTNCSPPASGPTAARPTSSTGRPRSTPSTRPPTPVTWPSAPSSPSSGPSSLSGSASPPTTCPPSSTGPAGRPSGSALPPSSAPGPATNGAPSSKAATPASPPSSSPPGAPPTPTTRPAPPSSRSPASSSPPQPPASAAPRAPPPPPPPTP